MIAYQFYYKLNANSKTQYMYVIAYTLKQAWYLFYQAIGDKKKYYSIGRGSYDINETYFKKHHVVGSIYGGDAII